MTRLVYLLVALWLTSYACDAYKILVVFPLPGRSHANLGDAIVRILLDAGHEVTHVTPFPLKPRPGLRSIDVSEIIKAVKPGNYLNVTQLLSKDLKINNKVILEATMNIAYHCLNVKEFQDLMLDPKEKFDLIIPEWLSTEIYCGLATVFNCPYIWFSSTEITGGVLQLIDEIPNPAYTAGVQSTSVPPFTFFERVKELGIVIVYNFLKSITFSGRENEIYTSVFEPIMEKKGRPLPSFEEMKYASSMVIGNSHVSMGQAVKLPQNYVAVGGYHIDPKIKPLPEDLKNIIENATHGVIYFSLGSQIKSKDLPNSIKRDLLEMFGELKQTVLWKFEEKLQNFPKNVHILEWAPQPSILSHPNCKLFITHGGLLSTTETIYFGKPVIGIPVMADQFINVERSVNNGLAKRVDFAYDMAEKLKPAIEEMISNPKYAERAQELSSIFHDRPISPDKEVLHWVEHVIKTNGAPHLRSPALQLSWYQKMYLDLLALIIVTLLVIIVALKTIIQLIFSKKKTSTNKKNN